MISELDLILQKTNTVFFCIQLVSLEKRFWNVEFNERETVVILEVDASHGKIDPVWLSRAVCRCKREKNSAVIFEIKETPQVVTTKRCTRFQVLSTRNSFNPCAD